MGGNSGTWSLQSFPTPAGAVQTELNGVDCTSATSCMAVARYTESDGTYWAMSGTWNGRSWTLRTVPVPASSPTRSILLDVSCSDDRDCTAVGGYTRGSQQTFAVRWNGTSWTHQTSPNPAGSTNSVLQNVSCNDRVACVAVGDWVNAGTWQEIRRR